MQKLLSFLSITLSTIILAGCSLPTPTLPPGPSSLTTLCRPDELAAPALNSPANWAIVDSLSPPLMWSTNDLVAPYPYDRCSPSGYRIQLRQGPFFTRDMGMESYGGYIRTWTPTTPLEPGSAYEWSVAAFVTSGEGPVSNSGYFFTGPICDTGALAAPDLLRPMNGSIVNTFQPLFVWDYPNPCVPEGYRIDLSTDPEFSDTSLSGGTGNPSTRWLPGTDLTDCTWYYWRVAPANGTTLGPFSRTRNFLVDRTGSCTYPPDDLTTDPTPFDATEPLIPTLTLTQNANCRFGDGTIFEARTSYLKDTLLPAKGRNEESSWIYVEMLEAKGQFCWVALSTGILNVDPNQLPVVDSPAPPQPPADNGGSSAPQINSCSDYTTLEACKADPAKLGCTWSPNNVCVKQ